MPDDARKVPEPIPHSFCLTPARLPKVRRTSTTVQ